MQTTHAVCMIKPTGFVPNVETMSSNVFQEKAIEDLKSITSKAIEEFNNAVEVLRNENVEVLVIDDGNTQNPDAVFPNNWFATLDNNLYLFPMEVENRRAERTTSTIQKIAEWGNYQEIKSLEGFEFDEQYLEGTGSMVLDRISKKAYCALSSRSHKEVLFDFCRWTGFEPIVFETEYNNQPIYHTNVIMSIGVNFAMVCTEVIKPSNRDTVLRNLTMSGKKIIEISLEQMKSFAGNALEVRNTKNETLLILSSQAFNSLDQSQLSAIKDYVDKIIDIPIPTIEKYGGGSIRCMLAELF